MNFAHFRAIIKPLCFWLLCIMLTIEVILHYKLKDLPYKFLNHANGPIRLLGQYSKKDVMPNEKFLAIIGDSNVFGFGPWLYDNSWSMGQPSFATHHLLHSSLGKDVIAYGYPGFGTMGASLSAVSEHEMIQSSWIWPEIPYPKEILFVFYEGNDLVNNIHEVEQRGIEVSDISDINLERVLEKVFSKEEEKLSNSWSLTDHSATWNLFSGTLSNYYKRFFRQEKDHAKNLYDDPANISASSHVSVSEKTNLALINGKTVSLGFCEGPALLLSDEEILFSLEITAYSMEYLKSKFSSCDLNLVYLPSALSLYDYPDCLLSPAPQIINGEKRSGLFDPNQVQLRNSLIRKKINELSDNLGYNFIDCTEYLKLKARITLLHGPRDPIHLNRKGYESFADAIISQLRSKK